MQCIDCRKLAARQCGSLAFLTMKLSWSAFILLHVICFAYFAFMAWCYWSLTGTSLDGWLDLYDIGLRGEHDPVIAIVHGCLAAIHLSCLFWMIGWSLIRRRFVLAVYDVFVCDTKKKKEKEPSRRISSAYKAALVKSGLFGVSGPYFDIVLLLREVVETGLQTQQAYKMSLLLPRAQLNRSYVILLVLNCWSTALVHSAFHKDSAARRLCAMVCDSILDLATSVGITAAILVIYAADFDFKDNSFPLVKWYEDFWIVHAINELKFVMITSWGDLIMRVMFAFSTIGNVNNMKKLLSSKFTLEQCECSDHGVTAVVPLDLSVKSMQIHRKTGMLQSVIAKKSRLTQLLFFAWGVCILVLHLLAESVPDLPQCKMQVKPWLASLPSCSLLVLDCYSSRLNGTENEVAIQWSSFDPKTAFYVAIRHCPNLEIPPKLTEFSQMKVLKIYNSTIMNWKENAAISESSHPNLLMLFLARVNMTNGELPTGLHTYRLPETLRDIEFCITNLRTLPEDFDLKWPKFAVVYFEACNFTEVPPPLERLAPFDVSLALNPISTIPATLIQGNAGNLHVGGTLISELPEVVNDVSPSFKLRVDNTNISFFWNWVDPMVASADAVGMPPIVAHNSPYCLDLQRVFDGEQKNFPTSLRENQSLLLSDASVGNWDTLKKGVSCDHWPAVYYPIEFEDQFSGVKVS